MKCAREGTTVELYCYRGWCSTVLFCCAYVLNLSVNRFKTENKVSDALTFVKRHNPRFELLGSALVVLPEPNSGGEREGSPGRYVSSSCWGGSP